MRKTLSLTLAAFPVIPSDRLYLDSPSAYLPENDTSKLSDKKPIAVAQTKRPGQKPLNKFKRASLGPPSRERYFPERIPIAKGLYASKLTLEKSKTHEN